MFTLARRIATSPIQTRVVGLLKNQLQPRTSVKICRLPITTSFVSNASVTCRNTAKISKIPHKWQMLPSLHHMQRCLYATSNPSLLLFDTSRWSTISYRVMGYISHVMLVSSMYFTPQLLFQHEWAPFSLRAFVAGVLVMLSCSVSATMYYFTKYSIFRVALINGRELELTLLRYPSFFWRTLVIPLSRLYTEGPQGRWLKLYVKTDKFMPHNAKVSAGPTTAQALPRGVQKYYLERFGGKFLAHKLLEDILRGKFRF